MKGPNHLWNRKMQKTLVGYAFSPHLPILVSHKPQCTWLLHNCPSGVFISLLNGGQFSSPISLDSRNWSRSLKSSQIEDKDAGGEER